MKIKKIQSQNISTPPIKKAGFSAPLASQRIHNHPQPPYNHPTTTLYTPYTCQPSGDLAKFMICPYKGHFAIIKAVWARNGRL